MLSPSTNQVGSTHQGNGHAVPGPVSGKGAVFPPQQELVSDLESTWASHEPQAEAEEGHGSGPSLFRGERHSEVERDEQADFSATMATDDEPNGRGEMIDVDEDEREAEQIQRRNLESSQPQHSEEEEEEDDDDDDDEAFVYPGASASAAEGGGVAGAPAVIEEAAPATPVAPRPIELPAVSMDSNAPAVDVFRQGEQEAPRVDPMPVDYARLSQLCSHGPLSDLESFFEVTSSSPPSGAGVSAFALANEPNPASGLVPLHYAAREGKTEILKWLVEKAGALVEMEDREGETALHKAALAGKLPALTFLLSAGASANCVDGDGWTPLHNACSRGYLDIAKVLVENAGATVDVKGGRGAWTPLMNAASNGHLPVVRYLATKHHADPFARNAAGETAYDVAAATFEVYICDMLETYEKERWAALRFAAPQVQSSSAPGQGPYNPLALHTTVPVILHENQRLDTRLSTLAVHGGKPRWSGTSAGRPNKPDRRAPGTMPPGPLSPSRTRNVHMRRDDIGLPARQEPYKLALPTRGEQIAAVKRARGEVVADQGQQAHDEMGSTPTPDSVLESSRGSREKAHFWLSEWQIDLTHPQVDANEGWQYAQSFDAPEERWSASIPPPLARLLEGRGLGASVSRAMTGGVLPGPGQSSNDQEAVATGWVRRRRWVRVLRRRLDIEFGDELEAAEQAFSQLSVSHSSSQTAGVLVSAAVVAAQQEARQECADLGASADYLARAKALAGATSSGITPADVMNSHGEGQDHDHDEIKKRIARLDLAVLELRTHAFVDDDADRQVLAEDLLKEYTLQLGQFKQAAGLEQGSDDEDDEEDDDEFIYPNSYKDDGQSIITRLGPSTPTGVPQRQSSTPSVYGTVAPSEAGTSLGAARSADLANATEFRVPTHEVPNRPNMGQRNPSLREQVLLPQWEHDADATECRGCGRRFTFFLRKHHCRRCGRIYCDACSCHRAHLTASELVIDPGVPEMLLSESSGPSRICNRCDAERQLPEALRSRQGIDALSTGVDVSAIAGDMSDVSSRASELNECPVCGKTLAALGDSAAQEEHVRQCLENGGGGSVQEGRYLVYKLNEGPIVGKECQICLEDLCVGMTIARLPCLCYYHRHW